MNKLQEFELEEMEYEELEQQSYSITDIDSLNWAFRKLAALKSKKKEVQQLADNERLRIAKWEEKELTATNNSIEFFEHIAKEYHMKQLELDPKSKSISTPYGKVKSTTSKAQPDKEDEEKLLTFVKENNLPFVKTTEEIKWGDFKKTLKVVELNGIQIVVDESGQEVKGATVKPKTTAFKVETE